MSWKKYIGKTVYMSTAVLIIASVSMSCLRLNKIHADLATGTAATVVGQTDASGLPDLTKGAGTLSGTINAGASNVNNKGFGNIIQASADFSKPVVDEVNHRLFVADSGNNRVVWYNLETDNTLSDNVQDGVIGQTSLFRSDPNRGSLTPANNSLVKPNSVAVDPSGGIWVADTLNNRVLHFSTLHGNGSDTADKVIGQANYSSVSANRGGSAASNSLSTPSDVIVSGTGVWVADSGNNRVLYFDNPAGDGSDVATKVIGQPNMTTATTGLTAGKLNGATGITMAGSTLWIADRNNHRALRYTSLVGDGTDTADMVFGQANFTTNNRTRPAQNALTNPVYVTYDSGNSRLYVGERNGNRVSGWDIPVSGDGSAVSSSRALGQASYTASVFGGGSTNASQPTTASSLASVNGLTWVASTSKLLVFDAANARVVFYDSPSGVGQAASQQIGQVNFNVHFNNGDPYSLNAMQTGLIIDRTRHILYISDNSNQRIVMHTLSNDNTLIDNTPDGVIGQPNLTSDSLNRGGSVAANTLGSPSGLALDSSHNLWVVDNLNSRVLRFPAPIGDGNDAADKVIGQANFTSGSLNRGGSPAANSLRNPIFPVFDSSNNLWISDFGNNRVVRYSTLVGDGSDVADKVIGQTNFTSNSANRGSTTAANSLNLPQGMALDSTGGLWIADASNNRLVRYSSIVGDGSDFADKVLGQANFTTGTANRGGSVAANTISNPYYIAFDQNNKMWLADATNSRVIRYATLVGDGTDAADKVLGQTNLTSGAQNRGLNTASANGMSIPTAVLIEPNGFWIQERLNQRVTFFSATPGVPGTPTTTDPQTDTTPNFTWTSVSDADHYSIQWASDSSFTTNLKTDSVSSTSCTITTGTCGSGGGLGDGTWYVRVRSIDTDGEVSSYSSTGSIVINTSVPTPGGGGGSNSGGSSSNSSSSNKASAQPKGASNASSSSDTGLTTANESTATVTDEKYSATEGNANDNRTYISKQNKSKPTTQPLVYVIGAFLLITLLGLIWFILAKRRKQSDSEY